MALSEGSPEPAPWRRQTPAPIPGITRRRALWSADFPLNHRLDGSEAAMRQMIQRPIQPAWDKCILPYKYKVTGTIYLARAEKFPFRHRMPMVEFLGGEFEEWGSDTAVQPEARLQVTPQDFPYLAQVEYLL